MEEDPELVRMLSVLWGKSAEKAGGKKNLLLSHLLDTAAVAERLWDGYLAPSTRELLDEVADGHGGGRRFFSWLCGIHDCGKATPAFQRLWPEGADVVRTAGLGWHEATASKYRWRHDCAGGYLLRSLLTEAGWPDEHVAWVWPLVAGHHGLFPREDRLRPPVKARGQLSGVGRWPEAQRAVVEYFTRELGFADLMGVAPAKAPSRAAQLHLSGLVVMADWIASDERHFPGVDELARVKLENARERSEQAWAALGLRGGWGKLAGPGPGAFEERFGQVPRPSQTMVIETAQSMAAPGLLVVEAPMGEGKTKAALLAAEVLAARFGADGVFVGMPTQATSDPMFSQVRQWAEGVEEGLASQVALLHGKRMFNREWRRLVEGSPDDVEARFGGVDEYGDCWDDDPYGLQGESGGGAAALGPAQWFLGAKRGLLCPFVVGTIDQLLFAATRTKHVMLRVAGLAGKVVILDEVHAADVYMSQFLMEGLRWLGQAGVPVVLLSATLPPDQRRDLVSAYLAGAASREEYTAHELPVPRGYPSVTAAWVAPEAGDMRFSVAECAGWRANLEVAVELLPESVPGRSASREQRRAAQDAADRDVAALLARELGDGGCALVIRNSVGRAQSLCQQLRERFGDQVRLLHGRLAVGPRADRTEECLRLLGAQAGNGGGRPPRLVLVATQLAEQSFDVDADLLVTDLAPIDLLLQRVGRLHRHNGVDRSERLASPRVVVTGFGTDHGAGHTGGSGGITDAAALDGPRPRFLGASEFIYGRWPLIRAAALVRRAASEGGWRVPGQVPTLVADGYGASSEVVPPAWREDEEEDCRAWEAEQQERAERAARYLLARRGDREGATLAGLHYVSLPGSGGDTGLDAVVRDGESSTEVILVVRKGEVYRTLSGRVLGVNGDVPEALLDEVLGGTVRLPPRYTAQVAEQLRPLPGWLGHSRLRFSPALVLDEQRSCVLADRRLSYDGDLGLVEEDAVT
ncbi:CRISPR-associated helicase Cas3' [Streptomyces sp. WAC 00631]|uniref:CRISPR-associated helicase Cas3' n=1 Tax=Streptomyces sp. WAC 00631 TaxID=2203201 RepID=UPI00163D0304|nr:CRISPR-associated helicase Cas3' [Streptomyces sp. WAC 00631]MCC5033491.1 CRISPR-associated helicase Cas3' [Streptomyces sp. WAC 00631]